MNNLKLETKFACGVKDRNCSFEGVCTMFFRRVHYADHKVLTYIEYRAVSGVFRTIDPPPSPPSECVLPSHQRRGVHTRRAVRGWGVSISEDARYLIGLLQYQPSTMQILDNFDILTNITM
jgi:hypothetical protein